MSNSRRTEKNITQLFLDVLTAQPEGQTFGRENVKHKKKRIADGKI